MNTTNLETEADYCRLTFEEVEKYAYDLNVNIWAMSQILDPEQLPLDFDAIKKHHNDGFPRITLKEALALKEVKACCSYLISLVFFSIVISAAYIAIQVWF